MMEQILNPEHWVARPLKSQIEKIEQDKKKKSHSQPFIWNNPNQLLSPLTLYKYLKARFGPPNGFIMLAKNPTSDNLIHWHYAISAPQATINILGKSSGIEITIRILSEITVSEIDWQILVLNLQNGFKKNSKEMKAVQSEFEQWSLFINPFSRIAQTLEEYIFELERLNLKEVGIYETKSKDSRDSYYEELKRWTKNITKAASLGTTVRMLCPVMAESFINLIILVFRKDEYKKDERLYDSLIRQQIDIRVKTLHLHCTCFPMQIDNHSSAFKRFHTLMNRRNDFLHGNIDPNKLIVEKVWFDQRTIPLFEKDEGIIKKTLRNYCTNVEPEKAIDDFQTISDLIELVLLAMDEKSFHLFIQIMADRMPGINIKDEKLGVLFPSDHLVENYFSE